MVHYAYELVMVVSEICLSLDDIWLGQSLVTLLQDLVHTTMCSYKFDCTYSYSKQGEFSTFAKFRSLK